MPNGRKENWMLDLGWEEVRHILSLIRISTAATRRISLTTMCVVQGIMGPQSTRANKGVHFEDNDI